MKSNIDKKILYIIILLCLGCQSTSNKIDNKSQKSLLPINNSDTVVSEELKYDAHCLKYNPGSVKSIKFEKSNIYYPSFTTADINTFNFYAESAYLFHFYLSFMEIYRGVFNSYQINVMGNPKYLFLDALENLSNGKYNKAYDQLNEYLEIEKQYESDPKKYYKLGCNVEDLDWLYSHKDHFTYSISSKLKLIIESFSSAMTNKIYTAEKHSHEKVLSEFKELLIELDDTPNTIDIYENIIFIVNKYLSSIDVENNKTLEASITSYRAYTWETIDILEDSLLISYLPIYNDSYSYILSSQLELSLYKKINYAKKIFIEQDILQMENVNLLRKGINPYSFCHYFELIQLYEINNTKINVEKLRKKLLNISLDWGYNEIISWVNILDNSIKKQHLYSDIEKMIIKHKEGKIDSSDYYFLYNQLFAKDVFYSIKSENHPEQSSLLYADSLKLSVFKEFSLYNTDYNCEEENLCNNIYPRILEYYYDIYEYHSDVIYHKFKNEIIHIGGKPENSINEGALSLLYAMDDIIIIYN